MESGLEGNKCGFVRRSKDELVTGGEQSQNAKYWRNWFMKTLNALTSPLPSDFSLTLGEE